MTIKKIGLSAIAATMVTTAAFAGTLTSTGTGKVAKELFQRATDLNVSIGKVLYKADINGSGTVNGPTFKYYVTDGNTSGITASDYVVVDQTDGDKTITSSGSLDSTSGALVFSAISDNTTVYNNHLYRLLEIGKAKNTISKVPVLVNQSQVDNMNVKVELWSTSGTEQLRDTANGKPYSLVAQYDVSCVSKFNNLINVENQSYTFVSTKHGALNDVNGSNGDVMNVKSDIMSFKVVKTAVDYGVGGNQSIMTISADDNTTLPTLISVVNDFAGHDVNNGAKFIALSDGTSELNVTDPASSHGTFDGLGASTNTYYVKLDVNGTGTIPPVTFTGNMHLKDANASYYPAAASYVAGEKIGAWKKFAYIAQIPGATANTNVETKLFVANRGCAAVIPEFTLVYGGKTTTIKASDIPAFASKSSIAANSQTIYKVSDIANYAATQGFAIGNGAFSVEITIPGNAEDFYVYAQAKNATDANGFKDLPVYNTSTRTY